MQAVLWELSALPRAVFKFILATLADAFIFHGVKLGAVSPSQSPAPAASHTSLSAE